MFWEGEFGDITKPIHIYAHEEDCSYMNLQSRPEFAYSNSSNTCLVCSNS